jgi:hypothetical protein
LAGSLKSPVGYIPLEEVRQKAGVMLGKTYGGTG